MRQGRVVPVPGGGPTTSADQPRPRRRHLVGSLIRTVLASAVLLVAYALAPMGRRPEGVVAVQLALWLLVFFGIVGWQILAVSRSPFPRLRAIEAVGVSLPLFLLVFASAYYVTGRIDADNFSEPLGRIDALYFSVTVFATVGFGDVVARTDVARLLVTLQMLADLVLSGLFAKVLLGAVQQRRRDLDEYPEEPVAPVGTGSPGVG
jgi:voltage-gated potassium channel